jgi:hypothetical protein
MNFMLQRANQLCRNVRWHLWQVTVIHTWQYTIWPITICNYLWCFTSTCHSHMLGSLVYCIIYLASGLWAGWPGLDPQQHKIFLFSTVFRLILGPTQPPNQWVPGALFPGVKWPGRDADHSPLSSAEAKKGGGKPPLPHMSSRQGQLYLFYIFT